MTMLTAGNHVCLLIMIMIQHRHGRLMLLAGMLAVAPLHAQETFESLRAGTNSYSNVTVLTKTRTDVYISHDGGFINLKAKSLPISVQEALGYEVPKPPPPPPPSSLERLRADPRVLEAKEMFAQQLEGRINVAGPNLPMILVGVLLGLMAIYLFFCYCCMLICKRTGNQPGVLIWIPILQMFPLLKAAGMPAWWFLMLLLPVLNVVASLVWCLKIAQACGKSSVVGVLLFLPVTGIFAFFYLAFSGNPSQPEAPKTSDRRIKLAA